MKLSYPYLIQSYRAFWEKTFDNLHSLDIKEWYFKKLNISGMLIHDEKLYALVLISDSGKMTGLLQTQNLFINEPAA
jgi:hypothetical protein